MKKLLTTCAAVALLAVPAAATASEGAGNPSTDACKAQRADLGKAGFAELYGKGGLGACKKAAGEAATHAAKACKAERSEVGADAFNELYGKNPNKRNSFGKCVSSHVKHAIDPGSGDDGDDDEGDDEETDDEGTDDGSTDPIA